MREMDTVINEAWIAENIGELRESLAAMWREMALLQEQVVALREDTGGWWALGAEHGIRLLELEDRAAKQEAQPPGIVGSIDGLEGEITVTVPPEWYT
jgi:uncharacterized coiled-coil protein SlyX